MPVRPLLHAPHQPPPPAVEGVHGAREGCSRVPDKRPESRPHGLVPQAPIVADGVVIISLLVIDHVVHENTHAGVWGEGQPG